MSRLAPRGPAGTRPESRCSVPLKALKVAYISCAKLLRWLPLVSVTLHHAAAGTRTGLSCRTGDGSLRRNSSAGLENRL